MRARLIKYVYVSNMNIMHMQVLACILGKKFREIDDKQSLGSNFECWKIKC